MKGYSVGAGRPEWAILAREQEEYVLRCEP